MLKRSRGRAMGRARHFCSHPLRAALVSAALLARLWSSSRPGAGFAAPAAAAPQLRGAALPSHGLSAAAPSERELGLATELAGLRRRQPQAWAAASAPAA